MSEQDFWGSTGLLRELVVLVSNGSTLVLELKGLWSEKYL